MVVVRVWLTRYGVCATHTRCAGGETAVQPGRRAQEDRPRCCIQVRGHVDSVDQNQQQHGEGDGARSKLPWLVSRTVAVVRTRVLSGDVCRPPSCWRLPSEITPAETGHRGPPAAASGPLSPAARALGGREAPSARSWRRSRGSSCWSAAADSAVTIGTAMVHWASTIAAGVYRILSIPNGPLRQSRMVTTRPATTGGSPMPVWAAPSASRRPGNRPNARSAPSGIPTTRLSTVAVAETCSDSKVIWPTSPVAAQDDRDGLPETVPDDFHLIPLLLAVSYQLSAVSRCLLR